MQNRKKLYLYGFVILALSLYLGLSYRYLNFLNHNQQRYSFTVSNSSITTVGNCLFTGEIDKYRAPFWPLVQLDSNIRPMKDGLNTQLLTENKKDLGHYRTKIEDINTKGSGFRYRTGQILFTSTDCSDPRTNNRSYVFSVPLHIHEGMQYTIIGLIIFVLLTLLGINNVLYKILYFVHSISELLQRLDRNIANHLTGQYGGALTKTYDLLKKPLFYYFLIVFVIIFNNLYFHDIYRINLIFYPDSYGYNHLDRVRPIATFVFTEFLDLLAPDYQLIPMVQYFMILGGLTLVGLVPGIITRNYWVSILSILAFLFGYIYYFLINSPDYFYQLSFTFLSDPLFIFFTSVYLFLCSLLIVTKSEKSRIWLCLGIGTSIGLAIITRQVGISMMVIIPIIFIMSFKINRSWFKSFKPVVIILAPIFTVIGLQSLVYKVNNVQILPSFVGYQMLRQAIPATFKDQGVKLTSKNNYLNADEALLLKCLLLNNRKIQEILLSNTGLIEKISFWNDSSIDYLHGFKDGSLGTIFCTEKVMRKDYDFLHGMSGYDLSNIRKHYLNKYYVIGAPVAYSLFKKIASNYPYEYVRQLGFGFFGSHIPLIDGSNWVNLLYPSLIVFFVFPLLFIFGKVNHSVTALSLYSGATIFYIMVICLGESPLDRYMLIARLSASIVFFIIAYYCLKYFFNFVFYYKKILYNHLNKLGFK